VFTIILGSFLIYSMVVSRCQRDERPAFVRSSSVLTSLLEGGLQEMIPDQGEFLSVHYDLRLVSHLFYRRFKVPKRREARVCSFLLSVDFFDRRGVAGDDT
jgi:hypothetical protein